ncbi:MAG: heme peroxidase, partial [Actinomycetota bacterium]|nr:heme peroxidase [Actinomycetota bacterium]
MASNIMRHGTWWDRHQTVPVDQLMEGRFTRLFPGAPAAVFKPGDLATLSNLMTAKPDIPPTAEGVVDAEENTAIEAGYTYFGQFIDHDLTLDPASNLREKLTRQQIRELVNFRTPRFDLDNVYGRGPQDQPYLYAEDGIHLLLGRKLSGNAHDPAAADVPRGPNGRALIGDPRNDENRIVAQLQATMLRFHNAMADRMGGHSLDEIRQAVRWHYQWVVINDFLPTIIQSETLGEVFPHLAHHVGIDMAPPQLSIGKLAHGLELMPVEFSVAAYRFGHSMVRPIYRINETIARRQIFSTAADPAGDLGGMRPIPEDWAVDWQFFIDLDHGAPFGQTSDANDPITRKPQRAYKIDTSLVNPLGLLPPIVAKDPPNLALRDLERGVTFGLPSGQEVAKLLGKSP